MSELMLPMDRDSFIAAILAAGTLQGGEAPEDVIKRYAGILNEIMRRDGTYTLYQEAYKHRPKG